jgi:hypothetical protein
MRHGEANPFGVVERRGSPLTGSKRQLPIVTQPKELMKAKYLTRRPVDPLFQRKV